MGSVNKGNCVLFYGEGDDEDQVDPSFIKRILAMEKNFDGV